MKWWRSRWLTVALAGLFLSVGLPLLGHWARRDASSPHCALDGRKIGRTFRVRIVEEDGQSLEFCCIQCAQTWLQRRPAEPKAILVTDESSGEEIDAGAAFFVRSLVQDPTTGSRIHVFRTGEEATRHAARFHGAVLSGREVPLSGKIH
jgi:hypothetical protein